MQSSKNYSINLKPEQKEDNPKRQSTSDINQKLFFSQKRQKQSNFSKTPKKFNFKQKPIKSFDYETIAPRLLIDKEREFIPILPLSTFRSNKSNEKYSDFLTTRSNLPLLQNCDFSS